MSSVTTDDVFYEVVDGQRIEVPPLGARELGLANLLAQLMTASLGANPPGRVFNEMLFQLRLEPQLDRRPAVAYVPFERWPDRVIPEAEAWAVIPALAVEIVSKTNTAVEIQEKLGDYFASGVSQAWVIYPRQKKAHVYDSPKNIRILDEHDTLEGGAVLPGVRLPVSQLFS